MPTELHAVNPDPQPPVIVVGGGGHCRVLLDTLELRGRRILFITDADPDKHGRSYFGHEIRGGHDLILAFSTNAIELVNGVGSIHRPHAHCAIFERFSGQGYRFATLVHPSAVIPKCATVISAGAQIMAGAVVQTGASIDVNSILNTHCSIDHDCHIGRHTHVAPGVTISGNVTVGDMCHVGTGASVIQGVRIGDRAVIAAGAVVVRDVPPDSLVCGVPARVQREQSN